MLELSKLAVSSYLISIGMMTRSYDDATLDDMSSNLYANFKKLAPINQTIDLVQEDFGRALGLIGTKIPALENLFGGK